MMETSALHHPINPAPRIPKVEDYRSGLELVEDPKAWQLRATQLVGGSLMEVESLLQRTLVSPFPAFTELLQYVSHLGGKRLRPTLTLLSALASGSGSPNPDAIRLAAVVELVHTATLVHDDMLDEADYRRHAMTIHKKWDNKTAILCGDWLFTRAYGLANEGESTLPGKWIADAACRLCEGEMLQNQAIGDWELSEKKYIEILRAKTGELCAVSCKLGAWTSDSSETICHALDAYGSDLGVAFQLHDDWLDYWGSRDSMGKPDHADLMAGKMTLPLIYLLDQSSEEQKQEIIAALSDERENRITRIHEHLERVSAELHIRRTAVRFAEKAKTHLGVLAPSPAREALSTLANLSIARFS